MIFERTPTGARRPPGVEAVVNQTMVDLDTVVAAAVPPDAVLPLYTPAQAAELLAVRESWLRRRAAARAVPCTFVGRHLRFSRADIVAIATAGACPVRVAAESKRPQRTGRTGRRTR